MLKELENQQFIQELSKHTTNIFVVGGYVRDMLLGVKSNDIDLLVCELTHTQIENIISEFGKVVETSGHFMTIKFRPHNWDSSMDDIDIVIPRTDVLMTDEEFNHAKLSNPSLNRHHAFKIISDATMGPQEDLQRRDLTINSICMNIFTGELIDPFNGQNDLKLGIIKMTNERTFVDDPVRMLRTLRFANRYNFAIESNTFNAIQNNAHLITGMSKERFLLEITKTFKGKGNLNDFIDMFITSNLQSHLFKTNAQHPQIKINRFSEFVFMLLGKQANSKLAFKQFLKGDNDIANEIEWLQHVMNITSNNTTEIRKQLFESFKISKPFTSELFTSETNNIIIEFINEQWISNVNELDIDGNEIKALLGINDSNIKTRGSEITKTQKLLISLILEGKIQNENKVLVNTIKNI